MLEAVLGILVVVGSIAWKLALPDRAFPVELWQLVAYTGALFLGIGLVRDVFIISRRGRKEKPKHAGEKLICFESVAGMLTVAAGLALLALDVKRPFEPALSSLGIAVGAVLIVSGWTKDVVMVFKREKDHTNLIPW